MDSFVPAPSSAPAFPWVRFVWLTVGIAISIRVLVQPESHTVFPVFALGSTHWWQDAAVYADNRPIDYFRYPPALAVAFTPFTWLGSSGGGILWAWFSLGIYFVGLYQFRREVLPGPWTDLQKTAFYLFALAGALSGLWNGQNNAMLMGLLLLGVSAAVREQWWPAAFFLAGPVVLKLSPLPLVLLFCALWPRKLLGRWLIALAVGFLMPFLTRPPEMVMEQYGCWLDQLATQSNERWPGFRDGWTIWTVLERLNSGEAGIPDLKVPLDGSWYRLVQMVAGLAVLGACLWMKRRGRPIRELASLTLALGAAWLMLLGPAVEHPTFAFLAPVLAWAIVQPSWPARWLALTAGVLILALGWSDLTRPLWPAYPYLLLFLPIGTICFFLWAVLAVFRGRRVPRELDESLPPSQVGCARMFFDLSNQGMPSTTEHVAN